MVEYPIILIDRRWFLYVHINKVNGKRYVGITSKKRPEWRWGKDGSNYKHTAHFQYAIEKYGWDNFQHIILEKNLTKSEASNLEVMLIKAWRTQDQDYGYNFQIGGYTGNLGLHTSQEAKAKMSGANNYKSKRVVCLNTKKIYDCQRDVIKDHDIKSSCEVGAAADGIRQFAGHDQNGNPLIWVRYEEFINMTNADIETRLNAIVKQTNERQMLCLNTMQIFNGIASASRYCGSSVSGITRCAQSWVGKQTGHIRRHSGKDPNSGEMLSWIYKDDYDTLSNNDKQKIFEILKIRRDSYEYYYKTEYPHQK